MSDQLSQFHAKLSASSNDFDWAKEDFGVESVYEHYHLKYERTPTTLFMDKLFSDALQKFSTSAADYESLFVRTRRIASLANQKL